MNKRHKIQITVLVLVVAVLTVIFRIDYLSSISAFFALLVLPGFWVLECSGVEDGLEKIALAFVLSVTLMALLSYFLSYMGLMVTLTSQLGLAVGIIGSSLVYYLRILKKDERAR